MKMKLGPWQRAWVRSLRNGFKQTTGCLCRKKEENFSFCCLGVACEMFLENGEKVEVGGCFFDTNGCRIISYGGADSLLPEKYVSKLGLRSQSGMIDENHLPENHKFRKYVDLADANDDGVSFRSIADAIEKYPAAFFKRSK